jgi:peroxiredoxin
LESAWDEFDRREVRLVCIAAQKIDGVGGGKRFAEKHNYKFPFLFDETRETTKAYGVYHRVGFDAYRIARPGAFLLDDTQKIRWIAVSPNQAEFPTNAQILEAIADAGKY